MGLTLEDFLMTIPKYHYTPKTTELTVSINCNFGYEVTWDIDKQVWLLYFVMKLKDNYKINTYPMGKEKPTQSQVNTFIKGILEKTLPTEVPE